MIVTVLEGIAIWIAIPAVCLAIPTLIGWLSKTSRSKYDPRKDFSTK